MSRMTLALISAAVAAACAQPAMEAPADGASLAGVRREYETVKRYITASADQFPEDKYSYRPTPEVRSFGELIGHIANSAYEFCAPARGEEPPTMPDAEQLTSKAELAEALATGFAYCDEAYAMSAADAARETQFFGQPHTRLSVLAYNMGHDYEHYGNIITYMRINGMVPPSSQGGG